MHRPRRITRRRLAGLAAALGGWWPPRHPPVVIAQIVELTGALAEYGDAWRNGAELAAQRINTSGGIAGRPVHVVTFDAQSTAAGAQAAAQRSLEIGPVALLGPALSGPARGMLAVPHLGRPLLTGSGAAEATGPAHPCTFRALPSDTKRAAAWAGWLRGAAVQRLAILSAPGEPYRDIADALGRAAREAGLATPPPVTVTNTGTSPGTGTGIRDDPDTLARLLHTEPDALAVLLPGTAAGKVIAAVRSQRPGLRIAGGESLTSQACLATAGGALDGAQAMVWMADDPAFPDLLAFQRDFLDRNKTAATAPALAGYVALAAVAAAMANGAADAGDLCRALAALHAIPLEGGPWDADGEPSRPGWMVELRQGRAVPLRRLEV